METNDIKPVITVGASSLQTELCERETTHALCVRLATMLVHEESKRRKGTGAACVERGPRPLHYLLELPHPRPPRPPRLHQQPGMPRAALPELELRRLALLGLAAGLTQDHPCLRNSFKQGREGGIRGSGSRAVPGNDHAPVIKPPAELAAHQPALRGVAFPPQWLGPAALPQGGLLRAGF